MSSYIGLESEISPLRKCWLLFRQNIFLKKVENGFKARFEIEFSGEFFLPEF